MPGQGGIWKCEQLVGITLVLSLNHPRPGAGRTLGVMVVVQSPAEHSPLATLGSAVPQPYRGAHGLVLSPSHHSPLTMPAGPVLTPPMAKDPNSSPQPPSTNPSTTTRCRHSCRRGTPARPPPSHGDSMRWPLPVRVRVWGWE